eukprot:UN4229
MPWRSAYYVLPSLHSHLCSVVKQAQSHGSWYARISFLYQALALGSCFAQCVAAGIVLGWQMMHTKTAVAPTGSAVSDAIPSGCRVMTIARAVHER